MDFTADNHLKYWIGSRLWGQRLLESEPYLVRVGAVDPERLQASTWQQEQARTANLIRRSFGSSIVVMLSGGTDSEIVLRTFVRERIPVRAVFVKFTGDYNLADLANAQAICQQLDQPLEIIDFDIKDFYLSGHAAEFAQAIQCRQIAYLAIYLHVFRLNTPAVMGGEMLLRRQVLPNRPSQWYYVFRENEDASAMRFSLKYGVPLVNEWFSYTPEMMAYYLEHETIKALVTDKYNYKLGSVSSKNPVLQSYMPELLPKTKTHGFEQLIGFNMETYESLNQPLIQRREASLDGICLKDLKQQLYANTTINSQ